MLTAEKQNIPHGFPSISQNQQTKVVELGHTAVLPCEATGDPKPNITWLRDLVPIDLANQPRFTVLDTNMPGNVLIRRQ